MKKNRLALWLTVLLILAYFYTLSIYLKHTNYHERETPSHYDPQRGDR